MEYVVGYLLGFLFVPSVIFGIICLIGLLLSLFNKYIINKGMIR